jgi:outer membrane immunogenic protein
VKAPVLKALPVAPYDWTGFYVGGHGGYAWTQKEWRLPTGATIADYRADGWIGGVQGGFNWQTGTWVIGVEAQASFGKVRKGVSWTEPDPEPWTEPDPQPRPVTSKRIGTTVENLGTIAARFGHAFDRSLVYVKGGGAWAYDLYRAFDIGLPGAPLIASATHTRWGWMAGIGYEYAFLGNWSAKIEFDYLGFGSQRITLVSVPDVTPPARPFDVRQDIALVKVGINYRFGPTAVAARY